MVIVCPRPSPALWNRLPFHSSLHKLMSNKLQGPCTTRCDPYRRPISGSSLLSSWAFGRVITAFSESTDLPKAMSTYQTLRSAPILLLLLHESPCMWPLLLYAPCPLAPCREVLLSPTDLPDLIGGYFDMINLGASGLFISVHRTTLSQPGLYPGPRALGWPEQSAR